MFNAKKCAKEYRKRNREKIAAYKKEYRKKNKEKLAKYHKDYYRKNKDVLYAGLKKWRKDNPEKRRKQGRVWHHNNPGKAKAKRQARRSRISGGGGSFTAKQWNDLTDLYGEVCLCCKEKKPLAADHVISLKNGGSSDISNIQPLCKSCNSRKGTKNTDYRQGANHETDARKLPRPSL